MLAAPGSSPRHLPPTSPDERKVTENEKSLPIVTHETTQKLIMGPPPPRKPRKSLVLEEDVYVQAIEKIVERDYFPDIPKLRNRLEWLEAIRTRDPAVIRETQLRIIKRKAEAVLNGATPSVRGTPRSAINTPNSYFGAASPAFSLKSQDVSVLEFSQSTEHNSNGPQPNINMSLDDFLRKYTSEDNASFSEIKEKDDSVSRAKAASRLAIDQRTDLLQIESSPSIGPADRKTDGFGSSGQPIGTLIGWKYKAKNQLMYDSSTRPDAPLTQQEIDERAKGPPKEVSRKNTRFLKAPFGENKGGEDETVAILYPPVQGLTPGPFDREGGHGKQSYDLEEMKRIGGEGSEGNYGFASTPSPAPGVDSSPFMTWGEIEGTPVRLEAEETPLGIGGSGDGPRFKMQQLSKRDETLQAISRQASKGLREKQNLRGLGLGFGSPSPLRAFGSPKITARSPFLTKLSAPAQKLMNSAMKRKGSEVDSNLRASYGGLTPGRSPLTKIGKYREGSLPLRSPSASPAVRRNSLPK